MADRKSVISQLQSVGEDALEKLTSSDVTRQALQSAMNLKDRAGKTITGFESIEKRLDAIEKRLAALEGPKKAAPTTRKTTAKTASKPRSTTSKAKTTS